MQDPARAGISPSVGFRFDTRLAQVGRLIKSRPELNYRPRLHPRRGQGKLNSSWKDTVRGTGFPRL